MPLHPLTRAALGVAAGTGALSLLTATLARDAERRLPPDGAFIDLDGTRLHYVDRGQGSPLILLHGVAGQLRNYTYALADLLAADHRVLVLDRPGYGYSRAAPGPPPAIAAQGRLVARFADALGLERPVLVGHSLGGAVALAAALDHPGRFAALALHAPLTQPVEQVPRAFRRLTLRSSLFRDTLVHTLAVPVGRATRRRTERAVFLPDAAPADFGTRGGGLLSIRPGPLAAVSSDLFAAAEEMPALAARYSALDLPVRILFGAGDPVLDPAVHGRRTAQVLPDATFTQVPHHGHMIIITTPEACAATVRSAMQASSAAGTAPAAA